MSTDSLPDLAAFQYGVVSHAQAMAAGLTSRQVGWAVANGRWVRLHRRVYLTQPGRRDLASIVSAAVLAAGRGAVVSHWSAAYGLGLVRSQPEQVHVTVPATRRVRGLTGVVVHRSVRAHNGADPWRWPPRTTVEQTVMDVADLGTADEAVAIAALACQRGLTWDELLRAELDRRPRHRRRAILEAALDDIGQGAESTLEVRFVRDVARPHGLPVGRAQRATRVGVHDVGYEAQRVLVELDGLAFHTDAGARAKDARRDRVNAGDGWVTVRALWGDVALHPCELAVDLGAVLTRRGWVGRVRPCRRRGCAARGPGS